MRSECSCGSIYRVLLFWDCFADTKPLSQIQRSTFLPLQDTDPTPSFGGFGVRLIVVDRLSCPPSLGVVSLVSVR